MASVTVVTFSTEQGAEEALEAVRDLQRQRAFTLRDAAVVIWPAGKRNPSLRQRINLPAAGGVGGMVWSMLFGLVFFTPLIGIVVGVALGTMDGVFGEYGIDDAFIRAVREAFTSGTSALFLITSDTIDAVVAASLPGAYRTLAAAGQSGAQEPHLGEAVIQH